VLRNTSNPTSSQTAALLKQVLVEAEKLPLPERRNFLKTGLGVAAGALVSGRAGAENQNLPPAVPPWTRSVGPGVVSSPYGSPSPFEAQVVRRNVPWLTATTLASVSFTPLQELQGIITPSGLVFERYHAGVPQIDPEQHRLMIHGLVQRPLSLTMADLMRLPSVSLIRFLECPANGGMEWRGAQMEALQFTHGMLSCCEWTGVPLSVLLEEVGAKAEGKWILAEGADGAAMSRSIPLEKALDDSLVVYAQNGEALRPEQGYPLRLLNPGWEGNTSIKWLRRLEVGDAPWHHREETSKYTDLMPDGSAREFTWVQECNSVITSPCPENPWREPGRYELGGLAWSGRGRIARVDVSIDGGVNWRPAPLQGLVLPKALTRFAVNFEWNGAPGLLQSRAVDETGYTQPTLGQLRKVRGLESVYHKNAIHTWKLESNGSVSNVQID
jgi:sulfane dehydrogenase subunit SoxC